MTEGMVSNCLFCKIIDKKISATIEYENDSLIAIQDINPQAPVHILVFPKRHIAHVSDIEEKDQVLMGEMIFQAKKMACEHKLEEGFRLVFNNGPKAGQSVFHVHLHLLGGRQMSWPPG